MKQLREKRGTQELLEAFDRERELVALELHDNVLQTMASALHHIQAAHQDRGSSTQSRSSLLEAFRLVRQSIDAARGLMGGLRPPVLDRLGLVETLRYELAQVSQESEVEVSFEAADFHLPCELELPLYRIIREAVANARKHSGSDSLHVGLHLQARPHEVVAEVRDHGKGFDPSAVPPGCLGLVSMHMRAKLIGGTCYVRTAVGRGTTVVVKLPLGKTAAGDRTYGSNQSPGS
ncbi:MAG: sensor histidine kinase [Chloroflexi bacterium]|nr:sensor histidine kinase [Chloroflexota bacterium]